MTLFTNNLQRLFIYLPSPSIPNLVSLKASKLKSSLSNQIKFKYIYKKSLKLFSYAAKKDSLGSRNFKALMWSSFQRKFKFYRKYWQKKKWCYKNWIFKEKMSRLHGVTFWLLHSISLKCFLTFLLCWNKNDKFEKFTQQ